MNIFSHDASFLGSLDNSVTEDSLLSIFRLAAQVKQQLGKQGYLLDSYLSMLFEGFAEQLVYDSADEGFITGGSLQGILFDALDNKKPDSPHPLYLLAEEFYQQHTHCFQWQERSTNQGLLTLFLADKILLQLTASFLEEQTEHLHKTIDIIRLQQLYDQIAYVVGEASMVKLNEQLCRRFLLSPLALVYAQGLTDDLLFKMISRDAETSKQIFQLFMEQLPDMDVL